MKFPADGTLKTRDQVESSLGEANRWYSNQSNLAAIERCAGQVREWMIRNKRGTDAYGLETAAPWLPLDGLDIPPGDIRSGARAFHTNSLNERLDHVDNPNNISCCRAPGPSRGNRRAE